MKSRQEFDYSHFKNVRVGGDQEVSGNGIDLRSSAASAAPSITAVGDDTNVDLILAAKGTGKFGYGTGSGGAVTQITSRSTGVTLNKATGQITTDSTSLAAGAEAKFVVTNSVVAIGDVIALSIQGGQTADTSVAHVVAVAAGSFTIQLTNLHATTADTGAMIINFAVIKAVAA